jgi:hypothetical protein
VGVLRLPTLRDTAKPKPSFPCPMTLRYYIYMASRHRRKQTA